MCRLVLQPYSKLQLAGVDYRTADDAIALGTHAQPGVGKNRVVRNIEKLRAKLEVASLAKSKSLHCRKVPVDNPGADHRVAAGVAVTELWVARQAVNKSREVEEVARILLAPWQVRIDAGVVGITAAIV